MTKTDYEIVAAEVGRIADKPNRLWVAVRLSAAFTVRDSKFDRTKFLHCASVWSCEYCEYLADSKQDSENHFVSEHYMQHHYSEKSI